MSGWTQHCRSRIASKSECSKRQLDEVKKKACHEANSNFYLLDRPTLLLELERYLEMIVMLDCVFNCLPSTPEVK